MVKGNTSGTERILLYLIGKMYSKEIGFASTEEVGNEELMKELGVPRGSVLPWVKDLRDGNKIKQVTHDNKAYYTVPVNTVPSILAGIERKISRK